MSNPNPDIHIPELLSREKLCRLASLFNAAALNCLGGLEELERQVKTHLDPSCLDDLSGLASDLDEKVGDRSIPEAIEHSARNWAQTLSMANMACHGTCLIWSKGGEPRHAAEVAAVLQHSDYPIMASQIEVSTKRSEIAGPVDLLMAMTTLIDFKGRNWGKILGEEMKIDFLGSCDAIMELARAWERDRKDEIDRLNKEMEA